MAPSTKPRHTNSTSPSTAPLSTSVPNLVSTAPTSSEPTLQSTLNAPRPPVKKLVPCDALGRYLTLEDRRDRSFMAILAAFSTVNNQALCVKELVDVIRDNQLLNLGGATPSGTINSAIRNHVNRCVDRQLPCFLSRHVLSGDASDERLSPSIGVKPHHRRRAPPIVPGEPSFSDVAGSPSTTSFALHAPSSLIGAASISRSGTAAGAAAAPLSPASPFASSTSSSTSSASSSPTSPAPSPSVVSLGAIHQKKPQNQTPSVQPSAQQLPQKEKIYLKNKNGRTRKGVCLWFLSPWTGFQNPFIREGFSNIGFLTDGKPVSEGEAYLSPIDFEFRWSLGTPSSPGFPAGGSGLKKDEMVMSVRSLDEMKVTTFFASATPPPSLVASASSTPTPVRAKPRKTPPSATSVPSASKTKVRDSNKLAPSGTVSSAAPTNGIINKRDNSSGGSPMRFLTPLQIPAPPRNSAAEASTSSTADDDAITGKQEQHQDQAKKDDRDSSSAGTDDTDAPLPQPQPQLIPPLASPPISSTIDTGSSDIEMDYSSDDAMSSSSDESDVAAETDLEDEQSEAATTVDPDEDLAHFGNWGYDDDAEDDDEDDEDGTLLITPRGSIVDGSPGSPSIHSPFAVTSAATSAKLEVHAVEDIQAFEGWCNFHAASTAMTMELSVGLNPHTSSPPITKDIVSQAAPSVRPAPLLLSIPPHEHGAIPHDDDLGSPFTPLSSAMSSERASPSPSSHPNTHQPVFDDLHMNLDIELAAQNGDVRRAAEDDILIDELLVGPEGALPQEFEEAWDDGGIASAAGEQEDPESTYPASPGPSESSAVATRSTTPITGASSRLRRYPYFGGSPSTVSPRAIVDQEKHQSAAGTPGRTYCPGICVPMHRPASREGTYAEVDKGTTLACPSITITLPSTPPRTPSPYLKAAVVTPQAELDALIVPGAAVSESPTPAALLLPSEDELANPVVAPKIEPYQYQPQMGIHPTAPPHLGSHQLEQIVINTTQPSNPPVCATFVDGVLVYTLTDPSTGQRLMRAVDTDYVHLSSLIAISHPPLRPRDACRIISLCHSPTIIMPSPPPAIPGVAPTITPLAGSWVPLEDAHMLCYTGELNIPQAMGELFLDRNLGEHYFPEPLPEWCKARRSLREPGIALCTAMNANGNLAVTNANVSVMAALAELARMGEAPSVLAPTSTLAPTPTEMISQLATPRSPDPPRLSATRHPLLASLHASMQENQRSRSHEQDDGVVAPIMEPLSPALSALSPPSSHIDSVSNPPSLVRSVSATSVSSDSSALSSPPTTPPPLEMAPGPVPSESAELAEFPKKRGPGRPRKHRGASVIPAEDKKQQKARNVAAAAPVTSRMERATARTLRSASGHWSSAYAS